MYGGSYTKKYCYNIWIMNQTYYKCKILKKNENENEA